MSVYTLQQSINWAQTYLQYIPLTAGNGGEPAVSIGSLIRSAIMGPPFCWEWNRFYDSTLVLTPGLQDYTWVNNNVQFIEEVSLTDPDTLETKQIKNIINRFGLAVAAGPSPNAQQRPETVAIKSRVANVSLALRFLGVPDKAYTVNIVYQGSATQMGPFFISACGAPSGGTTIYTGVFDPLSFPVGSFATITGFSNSVNNGVFLVISCTGTQLTLSNGSAVSQASQTAYAANWAWSPIPDSYNTIYNALFLGEVMAYDDNPMTQMYRQRGAAALLAKAEGLDDQQKNIFMQQWLARGNEIATNQVFTNQGSQGRAI